MPDSLIVGGLRTRAALLGLHRRILQSIRTRGVVIVGLVAVLRSRIGPLMAHTFNPGSVNPLRLWSGLADNRVQDDLACTQCTLCGAAVLARLSLLK